MTNGTGKGGSVSRQGELRPGPGFRVGPPAPIIGRAILQAFEKYSIAFISDCLNRLYAINSGIRLQTSSSLRLLGQACTVRPFIGDNLMVHAAVAVARPGEVIVVDASGNNTTAVLGELTALRAARQGIAGFVIDGLIRDVPGVRNANIPVYARGTTITGPLHRGPGEVNYPLQCGGVVVHPGDIIVGDLEGVVVVPAADASDVATMLNRLADAEIQYEAAVRNGSVSADWVTQLLNAAGCPIHE